MWNLLWSGLFSFASVDEIEWITSTIWHTKLEFEQCVHVWISSPRIRSQFKQRTFYNILIYYNLWNRNCSDGICIWQNAGNSLIWIEAKILKRNFVLIQTNVCLLFINLKIQSVHQNVFHRAPFQVWIASGVLYFKRTFKGKKEKKTE